MAALGHLVRRHEAAPLAWRLVRTKWFCGMATLPGSSLEWSTRSDASS